jgi:hypothetical protein
MADKIHTSPGCSPRRASASLTQSSLRRLRLRMNSISMPASDASRSAFSPQLVPERFRKSRIIEDPYFALIRIRGHSTGIADLRQRTEQKHPVKATQHSRDLSCVPLGQKFNVHPKIISNALFGSCFDGLGKNAMRLKSSLHLPFR